MSAPTLAPDPAAPGFPEARPGSRAARLAMPRSIDVLKNLAVEHGVCTRPITLRRTDLGDGQTELIDLPCGATREDKCVSCARRAKRLRQVQIREGWHRRDEPHPGPNLATEEQKALIELRAHYECYRDEAMRAGKWDQVADLDEAIVEVERAIAAEGLRGRVAPPHGNDDEDQADADPGHRRTRSTRRRQDVPDLPRQKVDPRTVGRVYLAPDGSEHQPSMWLTLTLDSYGPVHGVRKAGNGRPIPCVCGRWHRDDDPILGVSVDPAGYNYRRAAWDAVHFARLLDRYWQNLRRAVGWNVQYAGCVEPQRRLAPHAHFAIRGTVPRTTLERVAAATYHQVWWPAIAEPRYTVDYAPTWDTDQKAWVDPRSREPLTTWQQALSAIDDDPNAGPAHVVRFGEQVKARGVDPGSKDVDRTIGYITKYLTKNSADCHEISTQAQRDHLDRLWQELRVTPCSDRCANWLLYGIQPKKAHAKLRPGNCKRARPGLHRRHRTRRTRPGRLGTGAPDRSGHAAAATPAPTRRLPTHPMAHRAERCARTGHRPARKCFGNFDRPAHRESGLTWRETDGRTGQASYGPAVAGGLAHDDRRGLRRTRYRAIDLLRLAGQTEGAPVLQAAQW